MFISTLSLFYFFPTRRLLLVELLNLNYSRICSKTDVHFYILYLHQSNPICKSYPINKPCVNIIPILCLFFFYWCWLIYINPNNSPPPYPHSFFYYAAKEYLFVVYDVKCFRKSITAKGTSSILFLDENWRFLSWGKIYFF